MSNKLVRTRQGSYAKIYRYPCGLCDIVACTEPLFREKGWEASEDYARPKKAPLALAKPPRAEVEPEAENVARAMRRARAKVRRLALANEFRYFVTLTLDPKKIDRYDPETVIRRLSQWCSNQVKRRGLMYILVPEYHKDGAIHFHGFFNGALEAVPSGHRDNGGRMIYNLPAWGYGFTAAIEIYGEYAGAVAYVCKYIGKGEDKPGGRWYYSGGELREPVVELADIDPVELVRMYPERSCEFDVPGKKFAVANGVKL